MTILLLSSMPYVLANTHQPDLTIDSIKIIYTNNGWPQPIIQIDNLGASVTWNLECTLTLKKLFSDTTIYSKTENHGTSYPHHPNTVKTLNMLELDLEQLPNHFIARVFFEIDPFNMVHESNEDNNIRWTFMYCRWFQLNFWTLGCKILIGRIR